MSRFRMLGFLVTTSLIALGTLWPRPLLAEHFDITLKVTCGDRQAQAFMDTTPPIGGVNRRPVVVVKSGEQIRIAWKMKSGFPHGTMKAVTIHFFVVREAQAGQKQVPDPAGEPGIVDDSFVMDFAPDAVATGSLRFHAPAPGDYLIRIQSENTHQEHGHEHFSAIDLHVD